MALPNNLLGRAATVLDGAGLAQSIRYDFKGNPLVGRRRLATTYDHTPDWTTLANVAITDVETEANLAGLLETEIYPVRNEFDALNRPVSNVLQTARSSRPPTTRPVSWRPLRSITSARSGVSRTCGSWTTTRRASGN